MATTTVRPSRKNGGRAKDDLHVRIADTPNVPDTTPGEGGRYVYGIVQAKDHMNFGKIGIGGAGEMLIQPTSSISEKILLFWIDAAPALALPCPDQSRISHVSRLEIAY